MRKQKQFRIIGRPTLRAVDAAGAARGLGAIYASVLCRRSCRSMEVASGATDAVRWAVQSCAVQTRTPVFGSAFQARNHRDTHRYSEAHSKHVIITTHISIRKHIPKK